MFGQCPSYQLDKLQTETDCARRRFLGLSDHRLEFSSELEVSRAKIQKLNKSNKTAAILREKGSNGDRETCLCFVCFRF